MIHPLTLEQLKLGMMGNLPYLVKIDKNVNYETYEPMSYENWKLYRDLSPGKMSSTYQEYKDLKEEAFKSEIERRKLISLELKMFKYDTNYENLHKTKKYLIDVELDVNFHEWVGGSSVDLKNAILKL